MCGTFAGVRGHGGVADVWRVCGLAEGRRPSGAPGGRGVAGGGQRPGPCRTSERGDLLEEPGRNNRNIATVERPPTGLAAEQLQLEGDPLVPLGRVDPDVAGFDGRDEVVPHLVQVVDVALENLP